MKFFQKNKEIQQLQGLISTLVWAMVGFAQGLITDARATEVSDNFGISQTTWSVVQSRLRVRAFTEVMAPSLSGQVGTIPNPEGGVLIPSNFFGIAWADYELKKNFRVFYWQRAMITFEPFRGENYFPRDPRFGVRWLQVFDVPGLNTTYDVFLQPNITNNGISNLNILEFGFRTNTSYSIPQSRFNIGLVQEYTSSYFWGSGARSYGWVSPWASFDLNPTFYLMSSMVMTFTNAREDPWLRFKDDWPWTPYIQTGIGVNVNDKLSMNLLLNNHLTAPLNMHNSWASMWMSYSLL